MSKDIIELIEEEINDILEMIVHHENKLEEIKDEIKYHYREIHVYESQMNRLEKILNKIKGE